MLRVASEPAATLEDKEVRRRTRAAVFCFLFVFISWLRWSYDRFQIDHYITYSLSTDCVFFCLFVCLFICFFFFLCPMLLLHLCIDLLTDFLVQDEKFVSKEVSKDVTDLLIVLISFPGPSFDIETIEQRCRRSSIEVWRFGRNGNVSVKWKGEQTSSRFQNINPEDIVLKTCCLI